MDAVDWLKIEKRSWENQTRRSAENTDGNDTVPISVLRVKGVLSSECCCSSLVVFRVLCAKVVGETSSEGFLVFQYFTVNTFFNCIVHSCRIMDNMKQVLCHLITGRTSTAQAFVCCTNHASIASATSIVPNTISYFVDL